MGSTPQQLIADLARAFPRQQVTGQTVDVYVRELADLAPHELEAAVRALIRGSAFFPTIHEIRAACAELVLELPDEAAALAQVEARIGWARTGDAGDPPAVHPLVRDALELVGGWHSFRAADEPAVVRGQFLRLYRAARATAVRDRTLGAAALPPGRPPAELTA